MKKVLIVGKNSYIGTSFINYCRTQHSDILADTVSSRSDEWKTLSFSSYDAVLHVAGIAHVRICAKNTDTYYEVNRDLAIAVAAKAKQDGVKQFVFLSSLSVYMKRRPTYIDEHSPTQSDTPYGDSKLQAEKGIAPLASADFIISIVRPPMVYGKGCSGNFKRLEHLVRKTPLFPSYVNKRSMIYIENLCEFFAQIIIKERGGFFHPQNDAYVCTSDMVRLIAAYSGKQVFYTGIGNPLVSVCKNIPVVNKVFGNLVYDQALSVYEGISYQVVDFTESIKRSIR